MSDTYGIKVPIGMRVCGSKRARGGICQSRAVMANGRCMKHGGKSLAGIASRTFVTGRWSKHLPTRFMAQYAASVSDPDLLNLRDEISLLDSRMADVLTSVSNSESGELWKKLKDALRDYDKAARSIAKDAEFKKDEAFGQMRWLINEGYAEWQSWMELRHILQERKSLVDSERARLKDMQQMITAEQAFVLIGRITSAIRTHVTDQTALRAITAELGRITTDRVQPAVTADE